MCNDFLLWSVVETRLILQEGLLKLLLELGWYLVKSWSSQNLISSNKFFLSFCVFWKLSPNWARSSPSRWALRCGILTRLFLSTCSRSATIRVPFQTSPPAYQTYSKSDSGDTVLPNSVEFRIGQKQKWSDNHFNEPKKILWLNGFVEAPFPSYFSQIVAIHHGIHPPSSGQLQQLRKASFLLFSVPLISNLKSFWTVRCRLRLFNNSKVNFTD